jgi:hypothetical protein
MPCGLVNSEIIDAFLQKNKHHLSSSKVSTLKRGLLNLKEIQAKNNCVI